MCLFLNVVLGICDIFLQTFEVLTVLYMVITLLLFCPIQCYALCLYFNVSYDLIKVYTLYNPDFILIFAPM